MFDPCGGFKFNDPKAGCAIYFDAVYTRRGVKQHNVCPTRGRQHHGGSRHVQKFFLECGIDFAGYGRMCQRTDLHKYSADANGQHFKF
jgi:hypothetical protein